MYRQPREIKILQENCQSITQKWAELQHKALSFDIILLSETSLKPTDTVYMKGFDFIRWERNDHNGGGVMIMVNNKLKYRRIHGLYNCNNIIEICAIELISQNKNKNTY